MPKSATPSRGYATRIEAEAALVLLGEELNARGGRWEWRDGCLVNLQPSPSGDPSDPDWRPDPPPEWGA